MVHISIFESLQSQASIHTGPCARWTMCQVLDHVLCSGPCVRFYTYWTMCQVLNQFSSGHICTCSQVLGYFHLGSANLQICASKHILSPKYCIKMIQTGSGRNGYQTWLMQTRISNRCLLLCLPFEFSLTRSHACQRTINILSLPLLSLKKHGHPKGLSLGPLFWLHEVPKS